MSQCYWLVIPVSLTIVGSTLKVVASSSNPVTVQREQIQRNFSSDGIIPTSEKLLIGNPSYVKNIQVLTSDSFSSVSANFYTCDTPTLSCLLEEPRQNSPNHFSLLARGQDNLVSKIKFSPKEHQNILYIVQAMVNSTLIKAMSELPQSVNTSDGENQKKTLGFQKTQPQSNHLSQLPTPVTPKIPEQNTPTPMLEREENNQQPTGTPPNDESREEVVGSFDIKKYEFTGEHKAFTQEQLEKATAPFMGKEKTFTELLEAEKAVRDLYIKGCGQENNSSTDKPCYINSDVVIEAGQNISQQDGVVKIRIIEGGIEDIKVTGTRHLSKEYIRSRLALATGKPFNQKRLLEALQLLELDPLVEKISAKLMAGAHPDKSLLEVRVTEADPFKVELFTDNSRAPSVGSIRRGINLNYNNLFSLGDGLAASYTNTEGSNAFDASYTIPLNPRNGTFRIAGGMTNTNVVEAPFDRLDILGDSYFLELSYRQPLLLTPTQEFALGLTASRQESKTSLLGIDFPLSPGADDNGETRISALRFFQEWTKRSPDNVFALRSQFNLGINAFNATISEKSPDSRFFVWRGQAQYVRRLAEDTLLFLRSDLQLTSDALVPLEQFGLGGQRSVRGYRQDALLTDNAFFASAEVKLPIFRVKKVNGILQLVPFVDFGIGWNNSGLAESTSNSLLGAGLGLQWQMGNRLNARIDWGIPLIDINSRNKTWQENGIYFLLNYNLF